MQEKVEYGSAEVVEDVSEMSREEWLAGRSKYIGASDMAAILGLNAYMTPMEVWLRKTGRATPFDGNYYTRRGNHMEPFLREQFWHGARLKAEEVPHLLRHPFHEHLATNLDAWLPEEGVPGECKSSNSFYFKDWKEFEATGSPPAESGLERYYIQGHVQMLVTGTDHMWFSADCDSTSFVFRIERDEEVSDMIIHEAEHFWESYVEADEPPPLTGNESTGLVLKAYKQNDYEIHTRSESTPVDDKLKSMRARRRTLKTALGQMTRKRAEADERETVASEAEIEATSEELSDLEAEIDAYEAHLAEIADEIAGLREEYQVVNEKAKEFGNQKNKLKARGAQLLEGRKKIKLANGSLVRVSYTKDEFDVKTFKVERPELYEEYTYENDVEFVRFF